MFFNVKTYFCGKFHQISPKRVRAGLVEPVQAVSTFTLVETTKTYKGKKNHIRCPNNLFEISLKRYVRILWALYGEIRFWCVQATSSHLIVETSAKCRANFHWLPRKSPKYKFIYTKAKLSKIVIFNNRSAHYEILWINLESFWIKTKVLKLHLHILLNGKSIRVIKCLQFTITSKKSHI